jgi:hypothetical protein
MWPRHNSPPLIHDKHRQPYWERAFILGCIVTVVGLALDMLAHWVTEPWWCERLSSNVLQGICAGIFAYFIILDRERRIDRRFREVAYLNHHVRNALHAIGMSQEVAMETKQRIGMVRESSERIQRCLEKISRDEDVGNYRENPQEP